VRRPYSPCRAQVTEQAIEAGHQRSPIAGGHEQTGPVVNDHVEGAAVGVGHDRKACRGHLERRQGDRVIQRRVEEHVQRGQDALEIRSVALEYDPLAETRLGRLALEHLARRSANPGVHGHDSTPRQE